MDTPSSELWYDDAKVVYSRLARLCENAEPQFQPIYREALNALNRLGE